MSYSKDFEFNFIDGIHPASIGNDTINEAIEILKSARIGKIPAILVRIDDEDVRGEGFLQDPYFGVYDSNSFSKAKNMVRVGILTGNLLNHRNIGRKSHLGHLPINSAQLKYLTQIMNDTSTFIQFKDEKYNRNIMVSPYKVLIYNYLLSISKNIQLSYSISDFSNFVSYNEQRSNDKLKDVRKVL